MNRLPAMLERIGPPDQHGKARVESVFPGHLSVEPGVVGGEVAIVLSDRDGVRRFRWRLDLGTARDLTAAVARAAGNAR